MFSSTFKATCLALSLSEVFAPSLSTPSSAKAQDLTADQNTSSEIGTPVLEFAVEFSSLIVPELKTAASLQLPKLSIGFNSAAELFGLTSTDLVREVRLHQMNRAGPGHFDGDRTITLHINCLFGSDEGIIYRARHEALHAVDDWYRLQNGEYLSAGTFEKWFDRLSTDHPWFLEAINGQNLYSSLNQVDHAQDHAVEFFETLVSSLLHPTWKAATAEMGPDFYHLYRQSLLVLRDRIIDCSQKNSTEVIFSLIDARLTEGAADTP